MLQIFFVISLEMSSLHVGDEFMINSDFQKKGIISVYFVFEPYRMRLNQAKPLNRYVAFQDSILTGNMYLLCI